MTFILCSIVSTFTFGDDLIFLACWGVIGSSKGLFGSLAGVANTGRALGGLADAGRALGGLADAGRPLGELADAEGSLEGLVVDVSSSDAMLDVMQACQILCKSKKKLSIESGLPMEVQMFFEASLPSGLQRWSSNEV